MREARPVFLFGVPAPVLAAGVAFAAVLMGGATERLAQGIVLAAIGALMLAAPPASGPGKKWTLTVLALLALAGTGLLPAAWFHDAAWRAKVEAAGITLPATLSPQPRLTLDAWLLLAAGIAWTGWLMSSPWDAPARRLGAQCLTLGIVVLAALVLVQWRTGWRMRGWLADGALGPFPNRNHTSHVLALGGVLAVGCGADAARRGAARALPWLLAGGVVLAALAAMYSRGGVALFFSALALWNVSVAWRRRSWKILLLGGSALCLAASAVLVFGGPIAGRIAGATDAGADFRFRIWKDTRALAGASPWCGAGLGNFRALFPFFRDASASQSAVIHPESDWLWLAAEIGWPGVALALLAVGISAAGARPFERGTQRRLRASALTAAVAAVLHGFADVPGHRLGSALVATYLLALARRNAIPGAASHAAVAMWRGLGLAIVALGARWMNAADDEARAEALSQSGNFAGATERATRALKRAPLDWRPYFTRAVARSCTGHVLEAVADFRRARLLEPHYAAIPLEEGRFWVRTQPELALAAWQEALWRMDGAQEGNAFAAILRAAPNDPAFRARLLEFVEGRDALQIDWFLSVPAEEAGPWAAKFAPIAARCDAKRRDAFSRRAIALKAPPR